MGAVANLIENALARAIPLLIGFLASLLGLSGLAEKVTKIFQKIQQRVEKAVTKLWMKLKEMGKKVLSKLGIGGKTEYSPEKQQKIDAGFMYLKQQEQQQDSDGNNKLTLEQANQAAQRTKAQHPVFSSIHAVADGEDIAYEYTASPKIKKPSPSEKQEEIGGTNNRPQELVGKNTPNLDELENKSVGTTQRYVDEFLNIYKGTKYNVPGDIVQYVEHRAARKLGKLGEKDSLSKYSELSGNSGLTKPLIDVYDNKNFTGTPRVRIPDIFKSGIVVGDVKDVGYQSNTEQMRDNVAIIDGKAKYHGTDNIVSGITKFDLVVRDSKDGTVPGTVVSGPLKDAVLETGGKIYEII